MAIIPEMWRYLGFASPLVATAAYVGFLSLFPGSLQAIIDAVAMLLALMSAVAVVLYGVNFATKARKLSFAWILLVSSVISLAAMISLNLFVLFSAADI